MIWHFHNPTPRMHPQNVLLQIMLFDLSEYTIINITSCKPA